MFATGMGPIADTFFSLTTMLIAIPTGVKIFNWIGTMWGGSIQFRTPMYFALGFIAMFTIGGLSGVMHASPPADLQQTDTYFIVAHFHYVLFGGSIFGLIAGAYYWWPKMSGRMLDERLGKLHFWLMLIGFNLTFFPMHFVGLQRHAAPGLHLPRGARVRDPEPDRDDRRRSSWRSRSWSSSSTSQDLARAARTRRPTRGTAPRWSGRSRRRRRSGTSPEIPVVHGRDAAVGGRSASRAARLPEPPRVSGAGIHLPNPSYWPLVVGGRCRFGLHRP